MYPYLPENREIKYVGLDNTFMQEAKREADTHSTDMFQPTGAVVVKDGQIIGRAANQSALRNKFLISLHRKYFCIRKILKIKSGEKYWLCPGCASYRHHAEAGAVKDAAGNAKGSDLYLWGHWWCCKPCWDSMIKAGIKNVFLYTESGKLFKK